MCITHTTIEELYVPFTIPMSKSPSIPQRETKQIHLGFYTKKIFLLRSSAERS